jgi:hypothetical protein
MGRIVRTLLEPVGERFVLKGGCPPEATEARLLGRFDAFLLGYAERPIPGGHTQKIQSGGGVVTPAVSVAGAVWTWQLTSTQDVIKVTPFTAIFTQLQSELSRNASDLGRFLGRRLQLSVTNPLVGD